MGDVTGLLNKMGQGDRDAAGRLFSILYEQLRSIAQRNVAGEAAQHALQPTALVNELFLRLASEQSLNIQNRTHFVHFATRVMRRILIDDARRRNRIKRGGSMVRRQLSDSFVQEEPANDERLDLDEAMTEFDNTAPENAELVRMHLFAGLTIEECSSVLGVSKSTAERRWRYSRAWLKARMQED